jgi:predicted nucleic acid-binding Zn ribbon protein
MGRRAPRPISAALPGVLDHVAPKTPLAAVQLAWPKAVGPAIDRVASPISEKEGMVTIACASASWAEQLDLLQTELLDKLRAALGGAPEVLELRFRVAEQPPGDEPG